MGCDWCNRLCISILVRHALLECSRVARAGDGGIATCAPIGGDQRICWACAAREHGQAHDIELVPSRQLSAELKTDSTTREAKLRASASRHYESQLAILAQYDPMPRPWQVLVQTFPPQ